MKPKHTWVDQALAGRRQRRRDTSASECRLRVVGGRWNGEGGLSAQSGPPKSPTLQHRPRILFLDEPTSGLDPQTRNQIWEFIRGLCRDEKVTVFFTTHYMEEAERVADEIAVIDHGRIVAEGTAAALRQQTGGRTLEDAFIALTGHSIREADAAPIDRMRMMRRVWLGRR